MDPVLYVLYSWLFPALLSFAARGFFLITLFRDPCHTVHFPIAFFWIAYSRDPSWVLARVIHNTETFNYVNNTNTLRLPHCLSSCLNRYLHGTCQ